MNPGEETEVCKLIERVFNEFVAPGYSNEGVQGFLRYVQPTALRARSSTDHFVIVKTTRNEIVGVIEIRHDNHISLLFVDTSFQGRGIAKELLRQAMAVCIEKRPELSEVTVNSSPNAVSFYEMVYFQPLRGLDTRNGISFVPMVLHLSDDSAGITEPN